MRDHWSSKLISIRKIAEPTGPPGLCYGFFKGDLMILKKIVLHFSENTSNQPIVFRLVKDYGLEFNILKANIDYKKEGLLILELKGEDKDY